MKRLATVAALALAAASPALAFEPTKPVEFIATGGPGGGTDAFARTIQSIIAKHELMKASVVVSNKGGASGAEGFVYAATQTADPYKLVFGTNNEYLLPARAKVPYKADALTPVAVLAVDEFLLWANAQAPYADAAAWIAKAKTDGLRIGGSQSKDVDQMLSSMISEVTEAKIQYIPFKSGSEAATQLAGGHIDANVNNPSESIGQWKGGLVKPLCVFRAEKFADQTKVTADMGWSDIPTCTSAGIPIETFNLPRTIWLPAGVEPDAVAFYTDVLKKVTETPEWKEYLAASSQSGVFLAGEELKSYLAKDEASSREVLKREGWLVE